MKKLVLPLLLMLVVTTLAQTAAKNDDSRQALAVPVSLFAAMRSKDAAGIRALFTPEGQLVAIDKPRDGQGISKTRVFTADAFAKLISEAKAPEFIETMGQPEVKLFGDMALVFGRYTFYVGDKFSHCGTNSFHLVRTTDGWRIANAASTLEFACGPESKAAASGGMNNHATKNSQSNATPVPTASAELTQQANTKPTPRRGHCLVYDDRQRRVVLLDGYQQPYQPELGEVWAWDGRRWELRPGSGPTARSLCSAAFDSRRRKLISFGGVGNRGYEDLRGDTWEWDGTRWSQMTDTGVGTRDHHVMVFDASRGRAMMYGGQTSSRSWARDTWEWDGGKWTKLSVPGPGGRAHFAMVYDSKRKRVVLFGGIGEDNKYHNDTWEWDGASWRKVSDEGPPPRARHRMVFDSRAGVAVLYGGDGVKTEPGRGFRVLEDMWTWDGQHWTEVKTSGPGKRFMHAMAYDAARRRTVLYGGGDGTKDPDDTWEWDGKSWTQVK